MKNRTKLITGLLILIVSQGALADTVCSVQTLNGHFCHDGKVEVRIKDDKTFKFHNGDMDCWNQSLKIEGEMVRVDPDYYDAEGTEKFEMKVQFRGDSEISSLGFIKLNQVASLSHLRLNEENKRGSNGTSYHLSCKPQKDEKFTVTATVRGACTAEHEVMDSVREQASKVCSNISESYIPKGEAYLTRNEGPSCWSGRLEEKVATAKMTFTCVES